MNTWDEPGWNEAFRRLSPLVERFGFGAHDDMSSLTVEKMTWLAEKFEERERDAIR